jgi:aspartokinase-like uncharacterized kinase
MSVNQCHHETSSPVPLVVKIGGSLAGNAHRLVPILRSSPRPLFIVPGGGLLADAVRSLGIVDNTASHWMAIAAMDQYGWLLSSYGLEVTDKLKEPEKSVVFLPYTSMRQIDPLSHSWNVTSDTIAAWCAGYLKLELLILKSVDGIIVSGELQETVNEIVESKTVDPQFLDHVVKNKIRTSVINGSDVKRVEKYLNGKHVPGTAIGTTF